MDTRMIMSAVSSLVIAEQTGHEVQRERENDCGILLCRDTVQCLKQETLHNLRLDINTIQKSGHLEQK